MELKFRSIALILFVLASTSALARDNPKSFAPAPILRQDDPQPLPPDSVSSASYTIPDTDVDLRLVGSPQSTPGTRMVLAPDMDDGAIGAKLQIPLEMLDIPLE
jgi:hypothetical protein